MQCLTPIKVHVNTDKEATVPCGKCAICRSNRRAEWITRLRLELLSSEFAQFNTLTYDNDHISFSDYIDLDTGEIISKLTANKRDVQLFLKRLRKLYGDKSIRYFIISEYGDKTLRPHWHGLFFLNGIDLNNIDVSKKWHDDFVNSWKNGNVQFGTASIASITYCTKYMFKYGRMPYGVDDLHMLCSRRPAIGSDYISRFQSYNTDNKDFSRLRIFGISSRLPRLFRDKWKSQYLSDLEESDRLDEESYLKSLADKAVSANFAKLKKEFMLNRSDFSPDEFSDWLRWKLQQYKLRIINNQSKHDKL